MVVGDDSDFMIKVCLLCKGTIVLMRDEDRSKNNMIHCMNEFERGEILTQMGDSNAILTLPAGKNDGQKVIRISF